MITASAILPPVEGSLPVGWAPDAAWSAVSRRDPAAAGQFLYAVRTTGIFCRPDCPSRRPHRKNVRFFPDVEAARAAGFRACRRCRPEAPPRADADPIARAFQLVVAASDAPPTLGALAAAVGLSPAHLQRRFKQRYGLSPRQLGDAGRTDRFRALLRRGGSVSRALYAAGFGSSSRAYERATATLGMTPARYARGGRGLAIRYTVVGSPLGRLLVAVTERGVCAVTLGRSDGELAEGLGREFPEAVIERVDQGADDWLAGLVSRVAAAVGGSGGPPPSLDLAGTAFQRRVWKALLTIPAGETRSYGQLARAVGQPGASRAVAAACATNRVAVVVPCHRVIRADGSLGGYRWGVPTKRALLTREAAVQR